MNKTLSVAKVVASTSVDGPGLRTALYLQGCTLRCPGCHNSHLWDIRQGEKWDIKSLSRSLLSTQENISILGGEPLMQYPALLNLCKTIKKKSDRTIWLWTGYEMPYVELFFGDLLKYVDVIVDGPFVQELSVPNLKWRGSTNQKVWEVLHSNTDNTITINEIII